MHRRKDNLRYRPIWGLCVSLDRGSYERHSLAVRSHGYTDWITVDAISDSRICVAQLMYLYIRTTELLPAGVQGDSLFLSEYYYLSASGGFLLNELR